MTCPACNRPVATAAQVAAVEHGDEWFGEGACYAAALECDPACDGEIDAVALLALARCIPPRALRELARVLRFGGAKHGCDPAASGGGQTVDDHIEHARQHLLTARSSRLDLPNPPPATDADTGALHLIHAAARALLAAELVMAGEETGR